MKAENKQLFSAFFSVFSDHDFFEIIHGILGSNKSFQVKFIQWIALIC